LIPANMLREIDSIVGPRGRSAFLLEAAREELRRRKLLRLLESDDPIWQDKDHPDLSPDTAKWVRTLRSESEVRVANFAVAANTGKPASRRLKSSRRPLKKRRNK
jgi:hypothetical protein